MLSHAPRIWSGFLGNWFWSTTPHLRGHHALPLRQVKNPFDNLDKFLENRVRLQIMSVLISNDDYDYNSLKELLNVTDGNLASNLKTLEREKYISVNKSFIEKKPNTKYKSTAKGRTAFQKHLEAMEALIKQQK